jgi:uncharacterized protein YcaQ
VETLDVAAARRLAVAKAGLLSPVRTGLPRRAAGRGRRARTAAHQVIDRFGYLQLDTVAVSGARSHALVLMSRLDGFDPDVAEQLLQPGEPLFEYWGHEVSWIPLDLYPTFAFRRREFRVDPWYGDVIGAHPREADALLRRVAAEGPLRTGDVGGSSGEFWGSTHAKRLMQALWSRGELAVCERRGFQRAWDLTERVIPDRLRGREVSREDAIQDLLELALTGHGWATRGTLAATWRLKVGTHRVDVALDDLAVAGRVVPCALITADRKVPGWVRPADLELAADLERARPSRDRGVLLSPFDPMVWDRSRVQLLFGFEQVLEIFTPAAKRRWGYYCLPVLAGDRLVGRVDLGVDRRAGRLVVKSRHFETHQPSTGDGAAMASALTRHADILGLDPPVA